MENKSETLNKVNEDVKNINPIFYPSPAMPIVPKTRDEVIIDTCLDIVGLYGEERTRKEMEIKYRLGIWEKPPCER